MFQMLIVLVDDMAHTSVVLGEDMILFIKSKVKVRNVRTYFPLIVFLYESFHM